MLYVSLVFSGVLLAVAFLAGRYAKHPAGTTIGWAAAIAFLPSCLMVAFPAVWYQAAILVVGLLIAVPLDRARQAVRPLAVGSFVAAYAILGVSLVGEQREYAKLRERFPFESVEEQLPRTAPPSAAGDPVRLQELEWEIETAARNRHQFLATLHNGTTRRFVDSAGFGVGRMVRVVEPTERNLASEPRDDTPPQGDYFHPELARANPAVSPPSPRALDELHEASFLDFVNARGFGYVKDRRHVAGFQSHGFSKTPGPVEKWEVARLELVGLLLHETPVVYLSPKLPRMDELKGAPTRTPDAFESAALGKLRAGADLHVGDGADAARFVGAVRSTKQCVACHGGERGALLGAFTYRLRPVR